MADTSPKKRMKGLGGGGGGDDSGIPDVVKAAKIAKEQLMADLVPRVTGYAKNRFAKICHALKTHFNGNYSSSVCCVDNTPVDQCLHSLAMVDMGNWLAWHGWVLKPGRDLLYICPITPTKNQDLDASPQKRLCKEKLPDFVVNAKIGRDDLLAAMRDDVLVHAGDIFTKLCEAMRLKYNGRSVSINIPHDARLHYLAMLDVRIWMRFHGWRLGEVMTNSNVLLTVHEL